MGYRNFLKVATVEKIYLQKFFVSLKASYILLKSQNQKIIDVFF